MRYEIRPLGAWTDAVTPARMSSAVFRASWRGTLELLEYEAEKLGATLLVIQVDVLEGDIRRDGMLRAGAKVGFRGVVVSFDSRHGPLRYATDAYEQVYSGTLPGWQANVRAIALALEALRAVDRYGVTKRGEQYAGWKALTAGSSSFATAADAERWMRSRVGAGADGATLPTLTLYRRLARAFHPDAGGMREDWDRLDEAKRLLEAARRL